MQNKIRRNHWLILLNWIKRDRWHLDSGATIHMTIYCDLFQPHSAFPMSSLVRCGVHTNAVVGRREGAVNLELESGWSLAFRGVLYVPILRVSLLSFFFLGGSRILNEVQGKLTIFMVRLGIVLSRCHYDRHMSGKILQSMGSFNSKTQRELEEPCNYLCYIFEGERGYPQLAHLVGIVIVARDGIHRQPQHSYRRVLQYRGSKGFRFKGRSNNISEHRSSRRHLHQDYLTL